MPLQGLSNGDFKVGMFLLRGSNELGQIAAQVQADGQEIGNDDEAFEPGLGSFHDPGKKVRLRAIHKRGAYVALRPGGLDLLG